MFYRHRVNRILYLEDNIGIGEDVALGGSGAQIDFHLLAARKRFRLTILWLEHSDVILL